MLHHCSQLRHPLKLSFIDAFIGGSWGVLWLAEANSTHTTISPMIGPDADEFYETGPKPRRQPLLNDS